MTAARGPKKAPDHAAEQPGGHSTADSPTPAPADTFALAALLLPQTGSEPADGLAVGTAVREGVVPGRGPAPATPACSELESHITMVGGRLAATIRDVLDGVVRVKPGPLELARSLGVDKVLASRVLRAVKQHDPLNSMHDMPGPDPLRRLVRAAGKRGVDAGTVQRAEQAIEEFDLLIRERVGDRTLLDAILSAWIPEARRDFELRRKQSAFKAMSQLKGVQARALTATVVLSPGLDPRKIDVVWLNGLVGVHRVRPGAVVRLTSRRMNSPEPGRRPTTLSGREVTSPDDLVLKEFCSSPTPTMNAEPRGETMVYTLAGEQFGATSSIDAMFAEVNKNEIDRYVPAGSGRLGYFFAEVVPPAEILQFDVLVHRDLYPGQEPRLHIYDTSFEGVASVNNRARDIDRLDMLESVEPLGKGLARVRSGDVPRYAEMVRHVFDSAGWDAENFRGYRVRIDYPIYGTQVMLAFQAPEAP